MAPGFQNSDIADTLPSSVRRERPSTSTTASLAKFTILAPGGNSARTRSSISTFHSKGPSTDPCGHPLFTSLLETTALESTRTTLLQRYDSIIWYVLLPTSRARSLLRIAGHHKLSKAPSMSVKSFTTCFSRVSYKVKNLRDRIDGILARGNPVL